MHPYKYYYHPISQRIKLRHREITQLAQGHIAGKGQSPDSDPELALLTTAPGREGLCDLVTVPQLKNGRTRV